MSVRIEPFRTGLEAAVLAGLVAITCPCYWVSPVGSITGLLSSL